MQRKLLNFNSDIPESCGRFSDKLRDIDKPPQSVKPWKCSPNIFRD